MQAYPTLTCTGRGQRKICDVSFKGLRLETIQNEVADQIQEYLKTIHEKQKPKQKRRKLTRKKIQELEEQLEALVETASYSKNTALAVAKKIDDISNQIETLQMKLKLDYDERDLIEFRTDYISIFDKEGNLLIDYHDLDTAERQVVLRVLVNKIFIFNDGKVEIEYNKR